MNKKLLQNFGLLILALVFSAGLMYAFTALPAWLDGIIQNNIGTPHGDPAYQPEHYNLFVEAYAIKLIGMLCLLVILILIVVGFTTKKTGYAWAGAFILFLPVFATFAHSMFYLAGLGLFNTILFPFMDLSFEFLNLGQVILIPYRILMAFFGLFNWYAHDFLAYFFMSTGAFIFVLSVYTWLQTHYKKTTVARSWLYSISRHPQYLGWMIWSYGLMLYGPTLNNMKKSWGWDGSLAWLLSSMVIIGICLLEEIKMEERAGMDYLSYRQRTPFLFPVPKWLTRIISAPGRLLIKRDRPDKPRQVIWVVGLYTIMLMAFSLFWVDWSPASQQETYPSLPINQQTIDSLVAEAQRPQSRRYQGEHLRKLAALGSSAHPYIIDMIDDPDPVLREYSIDVAGDEKIEAAVPQLVSALSDSINRVCLSSVYALAKIKPMSIKDTLLHLLQSENYTGSDQHLIQVLSHLEAEEILPYLDESTHDEDWWKRSAALIQIHRTSPENCWPYIYRALQDSAEQVRRDAVYLILEYLPDGAVPYLEQVLDDAFWEVRFYAKQALKKIQKN